MIVGTSSKTSPLQKRLNSLTDECCQTQDVLILERRQIVKFRTAILAGGVNAIDHQTVEMNIS
jgi:hypothetical protein